MTVGNDMGVQLEDLSVPAIRSAFRNWLAGEASRMAAFRNIGGTPDEVTSALSDMQRFLYDTGWLRLGWPESVGGLGGNLILRALISEELAVAGYPPPFSFVTQEVLAPAIVDFGAPELSAEMMPRLLSGQDQWCQAHYPSRRGRRRMACHRPEALDQLG
jgi:alkylation response protein AidB-like acyl-CoA dehydrogenase